MVSCGTFRLAVGAVLVVFLPQHFGQDGLVLLIEFLGLLPLRAGRHVRGLTSGCLIKHFFGSISRQSDVFSDKKTIILGERTTPS